VQRIKENIDPGTTNQNFTTLFLRLPDSFPSGQFPKSS